MVWLATREARGNHEDMNSIDFTIWQSQATSLEHMVAYDYSDSTLVSGGDATRIRIVQASDGFWQVSGAQALLGSAAARRMSRRLLCSPIASFASSFTRDPQIVGRAVMVDGRQATIGAVLPEDFQPQLIAQAVGPGARADRRRPPIG